MGSAWTPWVRPMARVSLFSIALAAKAAMAWSSSDCSSAPASTNCMFSPVSSMSLEVMPRCSHRPSGPIDSVMDEMKAVTSWRVVSNSSVMRAWLYLAPRSLAMSASGMTPSAVQASQAANSTSSHLRYLFSSDQTCFMAGLEYLSITAPPPRGHSGRTRVRTTTSSRNPRMAGRRCPHRRRRWPGCCGRR